MSNISNSSPSFSMVSMALEKSINEMFFSLQDTGVKLNRAHALYALEDILGGHTAVACIAMRNLVDLAENRRQSEVPDLQSQIQDAVDYATLANASLEAEADTEAATETAEIELSNKTDMHLMNASMFETIRLTCSPIVPHQATRDSTVQGKLSIYTDEMVICRCGLHTSYSIFVCTIKF